MSHFNPTSPVSLSAPRERSDEELLRSSRRGTVDAFARLMRRHNQKLFRVARAILRRDDEAADAVQQAYLIAFARAETFRGDSSVGTWLTRITINEALALARKERRRLELDAWDAPAWCMGDPGSPSPEDLASLREAVRALERAIDTLPDGYRLPLVLREVEGLSTGEIAACLQISEEAVRLRVHRARTQLALSEGSVRKVAREAYAFAGARCGALIARVRAVLEAGPVPVTEPTT